MDIFNISGSLVLLIIWIISLFGIIYTKDKILVLSSFIVFAVVGVFEFSSISVYLGTTIWLLLMIIGLAIVSYRVFDSRKSKKVRM